MSAGTTYEGLPGGSPSGGLERAAGGGAAETTTQTPNA